MADINSNVTSESAEQEQRTAQQQCSTALARMASRQVVIDTLGITEPDQFDDEFWRIQIFTVIHRFYCWCAQQMGMDMGVERLQLDDASAKRIEHAAQAALQRGMTYADVRAWWLREGNFLHAQAVDARRERERIASMRLVVLLFFPEGRPYYLGVGADGNLTKVGDARDAKHYPVLRAAELDKQALLETAERFNGVVGLLGAKSAKVLPYNVQS